MLVLDNSKNKIWDIKRMASAGMEFFFINSKKEHRLDIQIF